MHEEDFPSTVWVAKDRLVRRDEQSAEPRKESAAQLQYLRLVVVLLSALLIGASAKADDSNSRVPVPAALDEQCSLERRWFGIVPSMPYGLWLKCGTVDYLVTEPMSLVGHVAIQDSAQALDFVRAFSQPSCDPYVRPHGLVEVVESAKGVDESFNAARPGTFRRLFHAPRVKELPLVAKETKKTFSIQRVMLSPDGRVYDVTETVRADGYYDIVSRKLLLRDGATAGLYYLDHWLSR